MKLRSLTAVLLAAGGGLGAAVVAGARSSATPRSERTHPRVEPSSGTPSTSFGLSFRLREQPGHQGVMATEYRIEVSPQRGAPSSCQPAQPGPIARGRRGRIVAVPLTPPSGGWCAGTYRVIVFLERGPYCPPAPPPQPCPEFATQEMDTGHARFTVR